MVFLTQNEQSDAGTVLRLARRKLFPLCWLFLASCDSPAELSSIRPCNSKIYRNLEASLIEDLARLNRLLLALFIAMWWVSHLAASCIHHGQRDQFDRHDRRDKSIFRLGQLWLLDILRRATNPAALTWCLPFQRKGTTWKFALRF